MLTAYKYQRKYCIDIVHGDYGACSEIFVPPPYNLALSLVNEGRESRLVIYKTEFPRPGSPIESFSLDPKDEDWIVPDDVKTVSPMEKIEISSAIVDRARELCKLEETLEEEKAQLRNQITW